MVEYEKKQNEKNKVRRKLERIKEEKLSETNENQLIQL